MKGIIIEIFKIGIFLIAFFFLKSDLEGWIKKIIREERKESESESDKQNN